MGRFSEWLQEVKEILDMTLFNKWLWIIVVGMVSIVTVPFLVMSVLLTSPWWVATIITVLIILGWGIAGGYKDYLQHKRKMEKAKLRGEDGVAFAYDHASEKDQEHE